MAYNTHTISSIIIILSSLLSAVNANLARRDATSMQQRVDVPLTNLDGSYSYSAAVHMGTPPQMFYFLLSSTNPYTAIAGPSCTDCASNSSTPLFNPNNSTSYVPNTIQQPITTILNGKTLSGTLGSENCGLRQHNGTWWKYPHQPILFGGQNSTQGVLTGGSGFLGFGMTNLPNITDSFIGQQFVSQTNNLSQIQIGLALNAPYNSGADTSPVGNFDPTAGDSSAPASGILHLFQPDPQYYSGPLTTLPCADQDTTAQFGTLPGQLGSYDWTVKIDDWQFTSDGGKNQTTGGQGTFSTIEISYPYILLTQSDAQKIFSTVAGAEQYDITPTVVASTGSSLLDDTEAITWSVPCSEVTSLAISFTFNGTTVPVQSNALYTEIQSDLCLSNIKGWADPQRTTSILGTTFLTSAYVVFSASPDATTNQVGIANRLFTGNNKSNVGAIVGGVIGGLIFLLLVAIISVIYIRRKRRQAHQAPSAAYLSKSVSDDTSFADKMFSKWGGSKKDRSEAEEQGLVVEPYSLPNTAGSPTTPYGDVIVVEPWTPSRPGEEAFLSPFTGSSTTGSGQFQQQQARSLSALSDPNSNSNSGSHHHGARVVNNMSPALTMMTVSTPPPLPPGAAYEQRRAHEQQQAYERDNPATSGYNNSPPGVGSQVMWVDRPT